MKRQTIPEFAIVGHPNEGKSSVLSTLAEDDTVRVSPIPGETIICQAFPVIIDNREIIRFIDTPGFQNPRKTLQWLEAYQGPEDELFERFLAAHRNESAFRDDCELLGPIVGGAGVIFVVDGSRPVRHVDRAEMEILRLSGAPRMAVINLKEDDTSFLEQWQREFRKHFNSIRIFNSCMATYAQRIELLESLKAIDQQLAPVLGQVVTAFEADWQARNIQTAEVIVSLLQTTLSYRRSASCAAGEEQQLRQRLHQTYLEYVIAGEEAAQEKIRALFKHNIFDIELPEQSILQEDLFSKKTWEFLGLSRTQLVLAATLGGGAVGAGIDLAASGLTFGVFSALGAVIGGAGTALKGKELLPGGRLLGMKMGGEQLQVGPVDNIQLLYILLDRCLLFYSHVINWSHGRRDYRKTVVTDQQEGGKAGYTSQWGRERRNICAAFFKAVRDDKSEKIQSTREDLQRLLERYLLEIAEDKPMQY